MDTIISEGKCIFCDKTFKKSGINRHFGRHLAEKSINGKPGKSFHLKVETNSYWGSTPYFLSLWVDGNITMDQLDDFLRGIWLECCGHLSSFVIPKKLNEYEMFDYFEAEELFNSGKIEEYEAMMERSRGEIPMGRKASKTFYKGLKLQYQYDFGSTTELEITVFNEYPIASDEPIVLLSRNEPLPILCETCGKGPAVTMCSICYGYEGEGIFCEKCAKKHEKKCDDFADYGEMPVVNSPRMGVCAYDGGTIDLGRDKAKHLKV
ncbi:hypothetical protein [Gelidibacter salicanalis]|uniref:Uncharacterized protein n=1 Tax=Gelidibacter salicanalis TaxID=291193 RepID=A0A934KXC6_9FLAO|nr:hypothetical protein [Gelidibacter salicanalis]MBJ7883031.1 hypothetical protein [Gelidibacter salicanalis]